MKYGTSGWPISATLAASVYILSYITAHVKEHQIKATHGKHSFMIEPSRVK